MKTVSKATVLPVPWVSNSNFKVTNVEGVVSGTGVSPAEKPHRSDDAAPSATSLHPLKKMPPGGETGGILHERAGYISGVEIQWRRIAV